MTLDEEIKQLRIQKYSGKDTPEYRKDVIRIAEGEALAYVVGFALCEGVRVDMSCRPMVPREETVHWVMEAIERERAAQVAHAAGASGVSHRLTVLDVFSGSGVVGALWRKHVQAEVTCAELHAGLLPGIEKTLSAIPSSASYRAVASDVLSGIEGVFDVITAVPPYVDDAQIASILPELEHVEVSYFASRGGGLALVREFLAAAPSHLAPGGRIYLELDTHQVPEIERYAQTLGYTSRHMTDNHSNPCGLVCALR